MSETTLETEDQTQASTEAFLVNRFGDHYLHSVNRNAFSQFGADAVLRKHLDDEFWAEDTLNLVIGTDSGLLVQHLIARGIPVGSRYLFIELPWVLELVEPRLRELLADQPRVGLCAPADWHRAAAEFSIENYVFIGRVRMAGSVAATSAYLPDYRQVTRAVKADLDVWRWSLSTHLHSRSFIDCQLHNLPQMPVPAEVLRDSFTDCTAVVLAGGPSLDAILPWVKTHRDRIVVVAVSRISRALQVAGIVPDIVCTIDPTGLSFDVSREMLEFPPDVLLVAAYHANPALLSQWPGPVAYLGERFPWKSELNPPNVEVAGPTVTNAAFNLVLAMGFQRIVFGGLDLCFDRGGNSHASGSNEREAGPRLGFMGQQVKTNSGEMADTTDAFQQSIISLQQMAASARPQECRLINPAAGAAHIVGIDHVPLEELSLPAPAFDLRQHLLETLALPSAGDLHRYYHSVLQELRRVEDKLREIREMALQGQHYNDGLFGRNGMRANFKYKQKMDKLEKRLDSRYADLTPLVKHYGIVRFLRIIRPDRNKEWKDHEIEEAGRVSSDAYRDGADKLTASIRSAQERIQLYLEAESPSPDIEKLAGYWRDTHEPGRARLWRQRHPAEAEALTEADQFRLDELDQAFLALLKSEDTPHMRRCRKEASIADVPLKASIAFRHGDVAQLRALSEGLRNWPSEEAEQQLRLVTGYLLELENQGDAALQEYQQINQEELLEESLLRIATLTMEREDFSNALLALDCLAHISPSYMPQLAELLRITGDVEKAAETYGQYLQHAPEDYTSLTRLGKLYLDNGVVDGARWAFEYILQREPQNTAAQVLLNELEQMEK